LYQLVIVKQGVVDTVAWEKQKFSTIMDLAKIASNVITAVGSTKSVPLSSLWESQSVVVVFLRRFG